jgi:hypothetical protein
VNWIKIASDMKADDAMGIVADECGVPRYSAVGLCVNVLGVMATKAQDGHLATLRDSTLEEWAGWDGKRGRFAAAFRSAMCNEAGVVRSWEKYNGAAIRKAEADIERMRAKRRGTVEGPSRDGRNMSQVDGDGDVNNPLDNKKVVDIPSAPAEVLPWVHPLGHAPLAELFAAVPHAATWVGLLHGYASGLSMDGNRPCDPARLAAAVQDFVAAGKHREPGGPSPQLFRGFIKRAKAPVQKHAAQLTEAEYKAEQLRTLRDQNERRRRIRQPERPEPAWAPQIDAMFPDGRTHPSGVVHAA